MQTGNRLPRAPVIVRWILASVWLAFGLIAKILNLVPRHRLIVERVVGDPAAWLTPAIGVLEVLLAVWILSGLRRRLCAGAQTVAIAAMNACELIWARDLLLAPLPMVALNVAFLSAAWYAALARDSA